MDTLHALWFWPLAAPQVFLVQMGKGTVSVALLLVPAYLWQVVAVGVLPPHAFAIFFSPILLAFSLDTCILDHLLHVVFVNRSHVFTLLQITVSQRMRLLCAYTHTQSKHPKGRNSACAFVNSTVCSSLVSSVRACTYIYTYMCVVRPKIVTLTPHFFSKFAFLTSYLHLTVHISSWVFLKPWTSTFFAVSLSRQSHPSHWMFVHR